MDTHDGASSDSLMDDILCDEVTSPIIVHDIVITCDIIPSTCQIDLIQMTYASLCPTFQNNPNHNIFNLNSFISLQRSHTIWYTWKDMLKGDDILY